MNYKRKVYKVFIFVETKDLKKRTKERKAFLFVYPQEKETVKELKKFLVDKCRECASKETRREFEEVMDGQHAVGFLINERFINIPPQIAVPVYKTLR